MLKIDIPLDEKKTIKNAEHFLKNVYPHTKALARRPAFSPQQALDGMPHSKSQNNAGERVIVDRLDAQAVVDATLQALEEVKELCGDECYSVLKCLFIYALPTQVTADRLHFSRKTLCRRKNRALIAFAEVFPNSWGELIEYNAERT